MINSLFKWLCMVAAFGSISMLQAEVIFLEAENFQTKGGWVVDQQGMDYIGSAYLLAHGLGKKVADASTKARISHKGTWTFFVRTRDWVRPYGPGRFSLMVNGLTVDSLLGVGGSGQWSWWKAGDVQLDTGISTVALHDRTGLDGRCDAIVITDEPGFLPPDNPTLLRTFRLEKLGFGLVPRDAGTFDVVVVGGGLAGMAAALTSARLGLKTCLIQDRPVLGGNASSEVKVEPAGATKGAMYPVLGTITDEFTTPTNSSSLQAKFSGQPNLTLVLNTRVNEITMNGTSIASVIGQSILTGERTAYYARFFVDCTGDGAVGYLAGADYRYGREGKSQYNEARAPAAADSMTMGGTVAYWKITSKTKPDTFPDFQWGMQFSTTCSYNITNGNWTWESGFWVDKPRYVEYVRDLQLRATYGNWSFLKKTYPTYANYYMSAGGYILGTRESRRLVGDYVYNQNDLSTAFPDGCVVRGWSVDLHCPDTLNEQCFPAMEFRSSYCTSASTTDKQPVQRDTLLAKTSSAMATTSGLVPYRCLYSKNIGNLFMAGRCASISHVAFGSTRVMKTGGVMGEVVGRAAFLCIDKNTSPRGVYEQYLPELITLFGKSLPAPGSTGVVSPTPSTRTAGLTVRRIVNPGSQRVILVDKQAEGKSFDLHGRVLMNIVRK